MILLKISKFIVGGVLCGSLLTACSSNTELSLVSLEQSRFGTPASASSLWASMGQHFDLNHETNHSQVDTQIAWLQHHQNALYNTLRTATPYISYVYEQTKKQGLPAELALLPIVESGFNPYAHSKAGANGLWQIMPNTAPGLGLKNNRAYDGSRDVVASTTAALNYLTTLHQTFHGNWEVALGAYNWGPGNMQYAVHHQTKWYKKTNFWDLHLPTQTENYLPKLLALAEVIQNPARYHIQLPAVGDAPQLQPVKVGARVDLKQVALSSGISIKTMRRLNPGYRNMATAPGAPNTLLVPIDKSGALKPEAPVIASAGTTASFTSKAKTDEAIASVSVATSLNPAGRITLVNAILKEGQWLLTGVTLPGTDSKNHDQA